MLYRHSRGIVEFLNKFCSIPLGRKTEKVKIPPFILTADSNIKCAFIRGLADTDFYLAFKKNSVGKYAYPAIRGSFRSKALIKDLEQLFLDLGFRYTCCYDLNCYDPRWGSYQMNAIYLNGEKNLRLWFDLIGFSNSKNISRFEEWKFKGECKPMLKRAPGVKSSKAEQVQLTFEHATS